MTTDLPKAVKPNRRSLCGIRYKPGDTIGVWTLVERVKRASEIVWRMRCVCGTERVRKPYDAGRHADGCSNCRRTYSYWTAKQYDPAVTLDPNRVKLSDITDSVSKHFGVPLRELHNGERTRRICVPRMVVYALARELTNRSLPWIGRQIGGRDHTTILHGARRIAELRKTDPLLDEDYNTLKARLTYRPANDEAA